MSASAELVRFKGFENGVIQVESVDGLELSDLRLGAIPRVGDAVVLIRDGDTAVVCATPLVEGPQGGRGRGVRD